MAAIVFSGLGRRGSILVQAPTALTGPAFVSPAWLSLVQIVQIVQDATTGVQQSSSNTYADTGLSATITPTSTSSRIFIIVTQSFNSYDATGPGVSTVGGDLILVRNSTTLRNMTANGGSVRNGTIGLVDFDSPATTSSVTYKTQFRVSAGAAANDRTRVQDGSAVSSIVLMEMA